MLDTYKKFINDFTNLDINKYKNTDSTLILKNDNDFSVSRNNKLISTLNIRDFISFSITLPPWM